jgi:uncharacterized protein YggT (Ycf19 family)
MTNEKTLFKLTQVVWYIFYVVETLLAFRFILKLLGANSGAGFSQLIYSMTAPLLAPFQYVLPADVVRGSVFEWSSLLALLVYWVLAWGIVKLILIGRGVDQVEAKRGLEMQEDN